MNNPKRELFYDRITGEFFVGSDIQIKIKELLDDRGYISLHEMYNMLAESMTEPYKSEFLNRVNDPSYSWISDQYGYVSYEPEIANGVSWINVDFNALNEKKESP